jgi:hypothetical protein
MKMSISRNIRQIRHASSALAGCALLLAATTAARAWDENIIRNCTEDYFNFCSAHSPDSPELSACMEAHRHQISKQCVKALIETGTVPKKYLANSPNQSKK